MSSFDRKAQGGAGNFTAQSVILDFFRNKTRLIQILIRIRWRIIYVDF